LLTLLAVPAWFCRLSLKMIKHTITIAVNAEMKNKPSATKSFTFTSRFYYFMLSEPNVTDFRWILVAERNFKQKTSNKADKNDIG
jgi:hypothetical protein